MRLLIALAMLSIVCISVIVFIFSQRSIVSPVRRLSAQLDLMALNKDLRTPIEIDTTDEVGTAGASVNELISAFSLGTTDVRESAASIVQQCPFQFANIRPHAVGDVFHHVG